MANFMKRPFDDDVAKMYGKFFTAEEVQTNLRNRIQVKVLSEEGFTAVNICSFDPSTCECQYMLVDTELWFTGSFLEFYVAKEPFVELGDFFSAAHKEVAKGSVDEHYDDLVTGSKEVMNVELSNKNDGSSNSEKKSIVVRVSDNGCRHNFRENDEPADAIHCIICSLDLTLYTLPDRESHINDCVDGYGMNLLSSNMENIQNNIGAPVPMFEPSICPASLSTVTGNSPAAKKPRFLTSSEKSESQQQRQQQLREIVCIDCSQDGGDGSYDVTNNADGEYGGLNDTDTHEMDEVCGYIDSYGNNDGDNEGGCGGYNEDRDDKETSATVDNDCTSFDCIVCNADISTLSSLERNQHLLECLTENNGSYSTQLQSVDLFCLTGAFAPTDPASIAGIVQNENHQRTQSNTNVAADVASTQPVEKGLCFSVFYCVICDINLSRRQLFYRCQHLKQCAKRNRVSTRELLSLLAPVDNVDDGNTQSCVDQVEVVDGRDDSRVITDLTSVDHNSGTIGNDANSVNGSSSGSTGKSNVFSRMMKSSAELFKGGKGFVIESSVASVPASISSIATSSAIASASYVAVSSNGGAVDALAGSNSVAFPVSVSGRPVAATSTTANSRQTKASTSSSSSSSSSKARGIAGIGGGGGGTGGGGSWGRASWGNKRKSSGGDGLIQGNYTPAYKKIQFGNMSVPIIVDGFQYASKAMSSCYFLTHFHSDHYMGLENTFDCGTIHCSPVTAALVRQKLKLSGAHIIPFELEKQYVIHVGGCDIEVTFMEANHCPGAVVILFGFENGKQVLHTGDFRWTQNLLRASPTYRALATGTTPHNMRNLVVYLDTTYCEAQYDFPPQEQVIREVVECVRRESQIPGTLFVFGAYTIGKERMFMAAADELKIKVHVDKTRWRTMLCFDWPVSEQAKLTTDPNASSLWVVSMNQINFNQLETLRRKKVGCKRVVAFSPTGWTHTGGGNGWGPNKTSKGSSSVVSPVGGNKENTPNVPLHNGRGSIGGASGTETSAKSALTARHKEGNTIYSVSYSEHSSFTELIDFIRTFRPGRVVPTVNTSADKVKTQLELLKQASGIYNNNSNAATASSSRAGVTPAGRSTTGAAGSNALPGGTHSIVPISGGNSGANSTCRRSEFF